MALCASLSPRWQARRNTGPLVGPAGLPYAFGYVSWRFLMYDAPPQTFEALIAPFPAPIQEIARWLRELILAEFPQVDENIYGGTKVGNALYSIGSTDRVALGIQPGERFVKLFVHDPEHLPPTPFKLEGSGKHMRHVKIRAVPEDDRSDLIALARVPVKRRL
jgi:hypothetical protein